LTILARIFTPLKMGRQLLNPPGIRLKRGDIVLVPFPFTDLTT